MKKIILSIVAVCAMAITVVSAQEFSYGAKVGMNISSIGGDEADDSTSALVGFAIGVTGEYSLGEKSAVSAELLYSLQGYKVSYSDYGFDYEYSVRLSYLNIPILYNYYIIEGLAVKAGIQPGFLLSAKYKDEDGSEKIDSEDTNGFALAIPIGVSYTFAEKFVVDARYNIGCTNVYSDFSSSNSVFQLSVGYKF